MSYIGIGFLSKIKILYDKQKEMFERKARLLEFELYEDINELNQKIDNIDKTVIKICGEYEEPLMYYEESLKVKESVFKENYLSFNDSNWFELGD